MEQLDAVVLGREYSFRCSKDEKDNLIEAVNYFNRLASQIQDSTKNYTNERVAVMAALQIASELMSTKVLGSENSFESGFSMGEISKKIDSIILKIESFLKKTK
ncbi:MAG: cell division protein ZapA [Candidatus Kinetoplastibacterium crithidii]|nr:MAG: cell division protein ZapA [Candidatus Kinetoplastibacterium crithidii]